MLDLLLESIRVGDLSPWDSLRNGLHLLLQVILRLLIVEHVVSYGRGGILTTNLDGLEVVVAVVLRRLSVYSLIKHRTVHRVCFLVLLMIHLRGLRNGLRLLKQVVVSMLGRIVLTILTTADVLALLLMLTETGLHWLLVSQMIGRESARRGIVLRSLVTYTLDEHLNTLALVARSFHH